MDRFLMWNLPKMFVCVGGCYFFFVDFFVVVVVFLPALM